MEKTTRKEEMKNKMVKAMLMLGTFICTFGVSGIYVQAANGNYAQNFANWVLEQIFWIALVAIVVAVVLSFVKKAWVMMIITIIGGGFILFVIKNPNIIESVGELFGRTIMG